MTDDEIANKLRDLIRSGLELARDLIERNGAQAQREIAVEEMAELIVAIKHEDRERASSREVVDEIADVTLCMLQLAIIYGLDNVDAAICRKSARTRGRMRHGQG